MACALNGDSDFWQKHRGQRYWLHIELRPYSTPTEKAHSCVDGQCDWFDDQSPGRESSNCGHPFPQTAHSDFQVDLYSRQDATAR